LKSKFPPLRTRLRLSPLFTLSIPPETPKMMSDPAAVVAEPRPPASPPAREERLASPLCTFTAPP